MHTETPNILPSKVTNEQMPKYSVDHQRVRYPFCIVWTPIPLLTWLFPFIGHMGIGMSSGVIRDFAGPYFVSEDNMAFGKPTKYWQLDPELVQGAAQSWDRAVSDASEAYKHRMHNLFCDNCHSHVSMALNLMHYNKSSSWNMVKLCFYTLIHGKYVRVCHPFIDGTYYCTYLDSSLHIWGFLKTWMPFLVAICTILIIILVINY